MDALDVLGVPEVVHLALIYVLEVVDKIVTVHAQVVVPLVRVVLEVAEVVVPEIVLLVVLLSVVMVVTLNARMVVKMVVLLARQPVPVVVVDV